MTLFNLDDFSEDWKKHYIGMPEYNNVKPLPPEITATFKFRNKEDFNKFMQVVKELLYNNKRVFDGKQKKERVFCLVSFRFKTFGAYLYSRK